MRRLEVKSGGWWGFATLENHYGVLYLGSHIETSFGRVELPIRNGVKDNPLYLVGAIHSRLGLVMGGQSHDTDKLLFYRKGEWVYKDCASLGVSMVSFRQDGQYCYNVTDAYHGVWFDVEDEILYPFGMEFHVDGIRAVTPPDNKIVTGYSTTSDAKRQIFEYIDYHGLTVGQANEPINLLALHDDQRYVIEPGNNKFIRAMFDGYNIALAAVKQDEKVTVLHWLNVDELKSFPIQSEQPSIPAIAKDCWVGWFEFNQPPPVLPPGNCLVAIRYNDSGSIKNYSGQQIARWCDGVTVEEIEDKCASTFFPCVAYWDGRDWPRWPNLKPQDYIAIQAYCKSIESPSIFELAMRDEIAKIPAVFTKIALVCQCYDSNDTLTKDLANLVPVFARLARDHSRVTMLLMFSDQDRKTGLNDHPGLRPLYEELFKGVTGIPSELPGGNEMIDWQKIHDYGNDRWAELEVNRISWELDPQGEGKCRQFQQNCFVKITSELFYNEKVHFDLFWKNGLPNYNDPASVADKLHHIGEDIVADVANGNYRDVVGAMGHPTADWNALGELKLITPGDESKCGPPPKIDVVIPPVDPNPIGVVDILDYDRTVRRSDPNGMLIRFDVQSPKPVVLIELELEDDGEPSIILEFLDEPRRDGRYVRALAFKPVVNGTWNLKVTARDNEGGVYTSSGIHQVTVIL